ncbi:hypothetical protein BC829DRAFT_409213 [Chytridium lagenaria]|nr:hypothetical protein BC829DRAFT_409213 [Chytridium lagenaria]
MKGSTIGTSGGDGYAKSEFGGSTVYAPNNYGGPRYGGTRHLCRNHPGSVTRHRITVAHLTGAVHHPLDLDLTANPTTPPLCKVGIARIIRNGGMERRICLTDRVHRYHRP